MYGMRATKHRLQTSYFPGVSGLFSLSAIAMEVFAGLSNLRASPMRFYNADRRRLHPGPRKQMLKQPSLGFAVRMSDGMSASTLIDFYTLDHTVYLVVFRDCI